MLPPNLVARAPIVFEIKVFIQTEMAFSTRLLTPIIIVNIITR